MDFAARKNKIRSIIGKRKADSLSREYIGNLMRDKYLTLNPEAFWALSPVLARAVSPAQADPFGLAPVHVTDGDLVRVENDIEALKGAVLATFRDGSLTVGEFVGAVGAMPPGMRPAVQSPQNLKDAVAIVVRNRYLADEARKKGLAANPEVLRDVEDQEADALARTWLLRRIEGIPVTAADLDAYRDAGGKSPDEQSRVEDIRRRKLREELPGILDHLTREYEPDIDTTALLTMIPQPKETIGNDPTPFVVRELFE
jgi:hypothetical protein